MWLAGGDRRTGSVKRRQRLKTGAKAAVEKITAPLFAERMAEA